jgi:ribonucleotide monophosphatase NagD (HAD superfamily)
MTMTYQDKMFSFLLQINCVLVGFDRDISYPKIMKAASYARREGALFLATNEDSHLPMDVPYVVPGQLPHSWESDQ